MKRVFSIQYLVLSVLAAVFFYTIYSILDTKYYDVPAPAQIAPHDIEQKLTAKKNTFEIKREKSLISRTFAGEIYSQAASYIAVDMDNGEVLAGKNENKKVAVASLTKVMTAVVTLDLVDANEQFAVSQSAANVAPTRMGLVPGQVWSRNELLTALLLTSANDAAEVLRQGIDETYGKGKFIEAMNKKARFLGLSNTSFDNPQGFDGKNNYSSASDLALLTVYALNNYPEFAKVVARDYQFYAATNNHKQADLYNWNGLLGVYPGTFGVKIGNTGDAGRTTIVASQRSGKKVLAVILGAPTNLERDLWAAGLLDAGFARLGVNSVNVTEEQLKEKYWRWEYFK